MVTEINQSVNRGISESTLKIIAMLTMFIDHFGATVIYRYNFIYNLAGDNYNTFFVLYRVCRDIGRIAFPLYCFLLVEGFFHTRSTKKYIERLAIFAIVSEIPFNLAIGRAWINFEKNNVGFTLLIGLVTITLIDYFRKSFDNQVVSYLLQCVAFVAASSFAYLLKTDYGAAGILAIVLVYVFYQNRILSVAAPVIALGFLSSYTEFFALINIIPIAFYNGKQGIRIKKLYYSFYPLHLTLLAILCEIIGLGI